MTQDRVTKTASPSKTARLQTGKILPAGPARGATAFVWSSWALLLLAALVFDWRYSVPVPLDELWGTPFLMGQPFTLQSLWEAHNGQHRLPLPKVVLLALNTLTGYDFATVAFFNPLALGAMAAALIWGARRLRGRTSYVDAFFPLILLHLGHGDNLLISWEVVFMVPVMITVAVLLLLVRVGPRWSFPTLLLAGIGIALHPLCGGPGVPYAPVLALWLGYAAVLHWGQQGRHAGLQSLVLLALAATTGLLTVLYFQGIDHQYVSGDTNFQSSNWRTTFKAMLQFLSMGLGPSGPRMTLTYYGGTALVALWPVLGLAILALALLSGVCLVSVGWQRPGERLRASALLFFLAGAGGLALGTGHNRGGGGRRFHYHAEPLLPAGGSVAVLSFLDLANLRLAGLALQDPGRLGPAHGVAAAVQHVFRSGTFRYR
jgi:hypothetical protein